MTNVMIDLETLGTGTDAMILTIAAVEFDPRGTYDKKDIFYSKVDIDSYKPYTGCFTLDGSTLTWWMTDAPESARKEAFSQKRTPIKNVLENFTAWIKSRSNEVKPWSHGASFDISILSHHFKILNLEIPWKFWDVRDTRTLYDISRVNLKSMKPSNDYPAHHAIGDCILQIEGVIKSYETLSPSLEITEKSSKKSKK